MKKVKKQHAGANISNFHIEELEINQLTRKGSIMDSRFLHCVTNINSFVQEHAIDMNNSLCYIL